MNQRFYAMLFWIFIVGMEIGKFIRWDGFIGGLKVTLEGMSWGDWIILILFASLAFYSIKSFKRDYLERRK